VYVCVCLSVCLSVRVKVKTYSSKSDATWYEIMLTL